MMTFMYVIIFVSFSVEERKGGLFQAQLQVSCIHLRVYLKYIQVKYTETLWCLSKNLAASGPRNHSLQFAKCNDLLLIATSAVVANFNE